MKILIDWKEKATKNEVKYETKTQPKFISVTVFSLKNAQNDLNLRGRFQESGAYKIILEIVMKTTKQNITSHLNICL